MCDCFKDAIKRFGFEATFCGLDVFVVNAVPRAEGWPEEILKKYDACIWFWHDGEVFHFVANTAKKYVKCDSAFSGYGAVTCPAGEQFTTFNCKTMPIYKKHKE